MSKIYFVLVAILWKTSMKSSKKLKKIMCNYDIAKELNIDRKTVLHEAGYTNSMFGCHMT